MKFSALILFAALSLPLASQAAYTTNFNGSSPTGGFNFATGNPADQDGWVISDTSAPELSFLALVPGYGLSVGLGGYNSSPAGISVDLTRSVSQPLNGASFSVDFSIINSSAGDPFPFFPEDDRFGFTLSDSGGSLLTIAFSPTIVETTRRVSVNGTNLAPLGIQASDLNNPNFYTLGLSFTTVGPDVNYTGTLAGGAITFSGILAGKAGGSITGIGANYTVLGGSGAAAGSNFMLIDNIALVPEPSGAAMGLLALGLLGVRRRR